LNFLKKMNRIIKQFEKAIISYGIIFISLILITNVITRQFFGYSWKAAEETSIFLIFGITFLSVSYAARTGKHITMTAILDIVPIKVKKAMLILNSLLCVIALLWISKLSLDYVLYVKSMGRITPALSIPAWMTIVVMPVGFFLSAIQYAITFVLNIKHKDKNYVGSEQTYGNSGADITL